MQDNDLIIALKLAQTAIIEGRLDDLPPPESIEELMSDQLHQMHPDDLMEVKILSQENMTLLASAKQGIAAAKNKLTPPEVETYSTYNSAGRKTEIFETSEIKKTRL